jgi:ribonucleoside-diphosphate reductase alpha chain
MSGRERLPDRRPNQSFTFELNALRYHATVSFFADGRVGEVFITNTKPSSQSDVNARDAAVAASLALQFGCPIDVLRKALLRDPRGVASSPLGAALDIIAGRP